MLEKKIAGKFPRNEGIRAKIETIALTTVWSDGGGDIDQVSDELL